MRIRNAAFSMRTILFCSFQGGLPSSTWFTSISGGNPVNGMALIGLRAREAVVARSREIVASNLALLDEFFARRADAFTWVRPRGGSTGFPRLVAGGPAGRSAEAFAARLVDASGVLLLPSTTFGFDDTHVRLGLGRKDLPDAMEKLEAFLDR